MATAIQARNAVRRDTAAAKEPAPIKYWAVLGVGFSLLAVYLVGGWLLSSDFETTPVGPTPVPDFMKISLTALIFVATGLCFALIWFMLIKPWRREGHITTDGLFVIAFTLIVWQDPLVNFLAPLYTYNTWLTNKGVWLGMVPGQVWGNGANLAEPLVLGWGAYLYCIFGVVVAANYLMQRAKQRWPQLGPFGLIMIAYAFTVTLDLVSEVIFLHTGYYTYFSTVNSLTLFSDKYYRFPIYEAFLWGITWTAMAALRYFKNDRGQTWAERGLDRITASRKQKAWLRFFAIFGVLNCAFMFYNFTMQWFIVNADAPPKDVTSRSYFVSGVCGEGTDYACYGKGIPFPRPGSASVNPDGLLVPGDEPIPPAVPLKR